MDNPLMFPTTHSVDGNEVIDGGITLRDHFAGLAMQGFLAHYGNNGTWDNLSEMSYQVADSMLKARKEVNP